MSSIELPFTENLWAEQVTIAAGASVSDVVPTQGRAMIGIIMPAAWTAAALGYSVSHDNVTFNTAYDNSGNLEQTTVDASRYICIPQSDTIFAPYFKITSVTAGSTTGVNQSAARTLILLFRRYLGGS